MTQSNTPTLLSLSRFVLCLFRLLSFLFCCSSSSSSFFLLVLFLKSHCCVLFPLCHISRFKDLPPSPLQYTILGLNLLRLLALNRISDFHTELELIPVEQHENVYIKHPVMLEQYIMEGSYNKVFEAAKDVPSDTYSFFMEYLLETRLKDEIAECSEKAYESLSVKAAQELLHFRDSESLLSYATERGWEVVGDTINLQKKKEELPQIPSINVIGQTLAYAKELERIV
ncbi:26S proteasome non-ATPase regulatory subunit 8, variant 2 [Balamuthia mandrillaris]